MALTEEELPWEEAAKYIKTHKQTRESTRFILIPPHQAKQDDITDGWF
jgi:hypothetical protein